MNMNTTPIDAATHAVVWLDHRQANVMRIGSTPPQASRVRAHEHPTAQHGSEVRSEHEFYAQVCAALEGIDAVLVTGSKTALADFRHYVEKHRPHAAPRIASYETVDHPTEKQLAALGRQFFEL